MLSTIFSFFCVRAFAGKHKGGDGHDRTITRLIVRGHPTQGKDRAVGGGILIDRAAVGLRCRSLWQERWFFVVSEHVCMHAFRVHRRERDFIPHVNVLPKHAMALRLASSCRSLFGEGSGVVVVAVRTTHAQVPLTFGFPPGTAIHSPDDVRSGCRWGLPSFLPHDARKQFFFICNDCRVVRKRGKTYQANLDVEGKK